jgi:hypothetical protein
MSSATYLLEDGEVDELVNQRVLHRLNKEYALADKLRTKLQELGILVFDIPLKAGGGSYWERVETFKREAPVLSIKGVSPKSLMQLAKNAYSYLTSNILTESDIVSLSKSLLSLSIQDIPTTITLKRSSVGSNSDLDISSNIIARLSTNSNREMQGRKFADAAFEYAIAGLGDESLFDLLVKGSMAELQRYGQRQSCR